MRIYDLMLSQRVSIMKFSRAISRVRWFSFVETNVSKTISVLVLRVVELTKMVFETLVSTKLNHLNRLIARENFIKFMRRLQMQVDSIYCCILTKANCYVGEKRSNIVGVMLSLQKL